MRSLYLAIIVSMTLFPFSNELWAQAEAVEENGKPIQYNFGHQYQIRSDILSEERQLLIYVPEEYQGTDDNFPVIYVLEGETHFQHAVISAEKIQKSGWMPASIIVAIADNEGTNTRDYRHETENFRRFINEEVQPFVAKKMRVNGFKTLFGHGRAGTFALETFIKEADEFDSYIVANPIIRKETLSRFDNFLNQNKSLDQSLYFSVGTVLDNGSYNVEPVKEMAELLKSKAPKSLQWKYQYLPLHGYHSSANVTLYDGLSVNFTDYQGPFIYSYQEFVDGGGMEGVKAYYRQRASKYHISDNVEIGTFMGLGFMFMDSGYPKESVELIVDAIENYFPESVQLHRVLGRAHLKMDAYEPAFEAYAKMVSLAKEQNNPRLDWFENLLEQVKQKM